MHFCDRQAAPCMGVGAWVGARCWLAGRVRGLFVLGFSEPVTSLLGGCLANRTTLPCQVTCS